MNRRGSEIELSVVLPCRNEEASLRGCIQDIKEVFEKKNIRGEIIVSDSSVDRSPQIAQEEGVVLVKHDKEGYGIAYQEGFAHVRGTYVFCADADRTYDFRDIPRFLKKLRDGADLVMGNRFGGSIHKKAMPWLHQYVGNPVLSFLLRIMFRTKVRDAHCGMRAISKKALDRMSFHTTGMEFASEMIVQALIHDMYITELSIDYYPREGESKLKTFRDGWRHMRFMLLFSPMFLFFVPGLVLFGLGVIAMLTLYVGEPTFFGVTFYMHPMFVASLLVLVGYQVLLFGIFAKTYAMTHFGVQSGSLRKLYRYATLEKGVIISVLMGLVGVGVFGAILYSWIQSGFGALQRTEESIVALTLIIMSVQTFFSSFMMSMLGIKKR